jgi:hypothetical protein
MEALTFNRYQYIFMLANCTHAPKYFPVKQGVPPMEQHLNVLQNKQISSEAYQLSIGYQLGAPQDELKVGATIKHILSGFVCLIIGLISLLEAFSTMTSLEATNQDVTGLYLIVLPLGLLLLIIGIYYLFYPIIFSSWRIYIYADGFVYKRGMKIDVFRWDHIGAAWMWNIKHYRNGVYAGTTHKYLLLREDGLKITLNDKFSGVERLGDRISQEMTNYSLPRMIRDYHAGKSIFFGPLQVNIQGINTIRQQLPWPRVQEVSIVQKVVKVKVKGKLEDWASVQVDQVPNAFILTALVNYILKDPAQHV